MSNELKYKLLHGGAVFGGARYEGDAGWDLAACVEQLVHPGETVAISTGVAVEAPPGYFMRITSRSSTRSVFGVTVDEGIIDNGWRGELIVMVTGARNVPVKICVGDRIAQILVHELHTFELEEVSELSEGSRGTRGFGSTGRGGQCV